MNVAIETATAVNQGLAASRASPRLDVVVMMAIVSRNDERTRSDRSSPPAAPLATDSMDLKLRKPLGHLQQPFAAPNAMFDDRPRWDCHGRPNACRTGDPLLEGDDFPDNRLPNQFQEGARPAVTAGFHPRRRSMCPPCRVS